MDTADPPEYARWMSPTILRIAFTVGALACGVVACGEDEVEDVADPTKCGPAPHVQLTVRARLFGLSGSSTAAGARFSSDLCPTKSFVTDADGRFTGGFAKDRPLILRGHFDGSYPGMSGEVILREDLSTGGYFIPTALGGLLPEEFDDTSGLLVATTSIARGATGACSDASGITLSLPGGTGVYFKGDTVPELDRSLMATASIGVAAVIHGPLGELVQASASKPGCTTDLGALGQTGRVLLEPGTLSGIVITLRNQ